MLLNGILRAVLITVNDSCSCVDVKSGMLCLTLDLNPRDKRKRKHILFEPTRHTRFRKARCRDRTLLCLQIKSL